MLEVIISACGGAIVSGVVVLLQQIFSHRASKRKDREAIIEKLVEIEKKLDDHIEYDEQCKADASRLRILRFADEVKNGVRHTEEHWNELLSCIDNYERYSSTHPNYPNNKAIKSIEFLKDVYATILEQNDFI